MTLKESGQLTSQALALGRLAAEQRRRFGLCPARAFG